MLPLLNEGPKVVKPYVEIFWSQPSKKGAEAPLIFALKKCCYDAKKQWLRTSAVSITALNGLATFAESFRSDGGGELQTVQRCVGDGGWIRTTDQLINSQPLYH